MQVIVTTHSPEVLEADWLREEHLRIVTWEEGATRILPLATATREALARTPDESRRIAALQRLAASGGRAGKRPRNPTLRGRGRMIIQSIVEGHGEVKAVPLLLRRLRKKAQTYPIEVNEPIRRHRSEFSDEAQVRKAVRLALKQDSPTPFCSSSTGTGMRIARRSRFRRSWVGLQGEAAGKPCAAVMAYREYEAWFLACIESLRGKRGILPTPSRIRIPNNPKREGATGTADGCWYELPGDGGSAGLDRAVRHGAGLPAMPVIPPSGQGVRRTRDGDRAGP